jgi:hypothetical protein
MLFGLTFPVYCDNYTEHTDTLSGQNVEFYVSQETYYVSATNTNRLMLFGERVTVYFDKHMDTQIAYMRRI